MTMIEICKNNVFMGPDLVIRNGKWICQPQKRSSSDKSIHGLKSLLKSDPECGQQIAELIIKNTYRTLITRGMKGCYIWYSNEETLEWGKGVVFSSF
jgi:DUF2075 family protein